eukprot:GABV01008768.1.p2 GENE.GABV01008768.1~~GABV01008768.1.p2  ORF type:complete len:154 (-),score=48.62 GABV01008768.1:256-717(-)
MFSDDEEPPTPAPSDSKLGLPLTQKTPDDTERDLLAQIEELKQLELRATPETLDSLAPRPALAPEVEAKVVSINSALNDTLHNAWFFMTDESETEETHERFVDTFIHDAGPESALCSLLLLLPKMVFETRQKMERILAFCSDQNEKNQPFTCC